MIKVGCQKNDLPLLIDNRVGRGKLFRHDTLADGAELGFLRSHRLMPALDRRLARLHIDTAGRRETRHFALRNPGFNVDRAEQVAVLAEILG